MKKIIAPLLLFLVITTVAVISFFYMQNQKEANLLAAEQQATLNAPIPITTVSGLIGSEKEDFFNDPNVQRILQEKYQLSVNFEKVGSRRIATTGGAKGSVTSYDFAFPAGTPAAQNIKDNYPVLESYRVFFTPMTIASWQPVVDVLEKNGIVRKKGTYYAVLDMQKLLALMKAQTRWKDLPNNDGFDISRQILVNTTDIRSSNSAAMYLSLASYLSNDDQIVTNQQQIAKVLPEILPLFANQGFLAGSSATPFEDYLLKGMGNSPMVMIYESQYLHQASLDNGGVRDDMVLLYPEPTIFTQHTLLAMTKQGKALGEALTNDIELQKLAIQHGYRSNNATLVADFQKNLEAHNLKNVPPSINEVIDTPSYEVLETMIESIEKSLAQ